MQKPGPIISAVDLGKKIQMTSRSLEILRDINFSIEKGQSAAVVGISGSGKSTLLGLLAGLDTPTNGSIQINGHEITQMTEDQRADIRAKHVGFVFQSFQLLPNLTALENVMLPMEILNQGNATAQAEDILSRVGLKDRIEHYPKQLSGGEQQRVALARSFVTQPDILFADEPTGNLDQVTGANIADLLFELNQEKQSTLVLVTHDPDLADRCERKFRMQSGQLSEQMTL